MTSAKSIFFNTRFVSRVDCNKTHVLARVRSCVCNFERKNFGWDLGGDHRIAPRRFWLRSGNRKIRDKKETVLQSISRARKLQDILGRLILNQFITWYDRVNPAMERTNPSVHARLERKTILSAIGGDPFKDPYSIIVTYQRTSAVTCTSTVLLLLRRAE